MILKVFSNGTYLFITANKLYTRVLWYLCLGQFTWAMGGEKLRTSYFSMLS